MRSIQGTPIGMGSIAPTPLALSGGSEWRHRGRGPGWPTDPATWDPAPVTGDGAPPAEVSKVRRQRRLREYEALMRAEPGLTQAEAARRMGLAPKTVRSLARELDPAGTVVSDQAAAKQQKMALFAAAVAAQRNPSQPNVAAASRAAGISATTGYAYWQQMQAEAARSQEAAS